MTLVLPGVWFSKILSCISLKETWKDNGRELIQPSTYPTHNIIWQRNTNVEKRHHTPFEPPHDKTNKMTAVRPAKTQISLGIRLVWSESSLCARWVAKDTAFLRADSEDSDQTGRMPRLIWGFAGRTCHFIGFVMRRLSYVYIPWTCILINIERVSKHSVTVSDYVL